MKRTKEVYKGGYYLFESKAAANSNYIESLSEAKQLIKYARYYLRHYLLIHDYVITRHGWQMVISINSPNSKIDDSERVWIQISERIRLFLSSYVRCINRWRNRSGVLVASNYARYYFESMEEAEVHLKMVRNQQLRIYQKRKRYRGRKHHYRIGRKEALGSVFLCSKELDRTEEKGIRKVWGPIFIGLTILVGQKLIKSTLKLHTRAKSYQNHQNSS